MLRDRHGVDFLWIFRSTRDTLITETYWENSKVILVPKPDSRMGILRSYVGYFNDLKNAVKVANRCYRADAIHAFDEPLMGLVAYLTSRTRKIPFVYQVTHLKEEETILHGKFHIYGSPVANYLKGKIGWLIRNWVLKRADLVFAVSAQMKELFIKYGVNSERIVVIQAGVDCSISIQENRISAKSTRESLGLLNSRVLFYMGTLSQFRKLDFMLDVVKQVSERFEDVKLIVVSGSAEDREWFKSQAEERSVGQRILMIETLPRNELHRYISVADICLAPYEPNVVHNCNSPTKLLEYLLMGKVIVGTNIPSQRDVIDKLGTGGYCVDHTVEAYSQAICRFFDRAQEISDADLARIQTYLRAERSFEAISEEVFNGYCRLPAA